MTTNEEYKFITTLVKRHSIKPATERNLSLLALSCIAFGYTKIQKKVLGFSYEVVAGLGGNGKWHSLLDEAGIAVKTDEYIRNHIETIDETVFNPIQKIFKDFKKVFYNEKKKISTQPKDFLKKIVSLYPTYAVCIGTYNCFWRYFGNNSEGKLLADRIEQIGKEREEIAKLYPDIEKSISDASINLGQQEGYDGELFKYFTWKETEEYFSDKIKIKDQLKKLEKRRSGYFYIFIENSEKEYIYTEREMLEKIKTDLYSVHEVKEIKGFVAFKGHVHGKVVNLATIMENREAYINSDSVIVTSMTHPEDIIIIKKCAAIITDEGGILSHAAIVSRELKKPCIIGTKIATQVLKDGDMVEVDADKGIVKILNK